VKISKCKECGDNPCICHCKKTDKWAAHCMNCDNAIGEIGYYHPIADSKKQAEKLWNELNKT